MGAPRSVGVLVVEADDELRDLFEAIVTLAEGFRLVAAVDGVGDAVGTAGRLRPDVVVVDVDGAESTTAGARVRQLRDASPSSQIVALSGFPDPLTLLDVLRNGAADYLDRATAWRDLVPTLRTLSRSAA